MINTDFNSQMEWINLMTPITNKKMQNLKSVSYKNIKLAYAGHVEPKMISHIEFFINHGVEMFIAPCVPGVVHQESWINEVLRINSCTDGITEVKFGYSQLGETNIKTGRDFYG